MYRLNEFDILFKQRNKQSNKRPGMINHKIEYQGL
jgi:hypothetical protein